MEFHMDFYEELKNRKILLVEDDPWIRDSLSLFFRNKGCRLVALESVKEAIAAIDEESFDIVICDYWMPHMDGLSFLAQVGRTQPDTIRILLSAFPVGEVASDAGRTDIHDFLQKPLTIEGMERSLGRLMERRSR